jgi:cytochrome c oxidase accessory protein FixG
MSKSSDVLNGGTSYRYKRYWFFGLVSLIVFILPWIKVNGNHLFLLSFDKKQLHLLFTAFDMQELYLLPFLLILSFLGVFFLTTLGGRIWCGWACPQTIFRVIYRDLIETKILGIRKRISNKQQEVDGQIVKKSIAILIWTVLSFMAAANFSWYFVPPEDFLTYMQNPAEHTVLTTMLLILTAFLVWLVVKSKEDFCIYVCPYARVQSVMYDEETIQTIYNAQRGGEIYAKDPATGQPIGEKLYSKQKDIQAVWESAECTACESCVKVCPTHIDIRKGTQLECINCLECADACTKVMGALGKESLITWNSATAVKEKRKPKFIRFRTVAYSVALLIAFVALMLMSGTKEYMLLNVNRTTQLYKVDDDKMVKNSYTFLFQNTDSKDHRYYFEIVDNPDIKIIRPNKPFKLLAGKKVKKIVVLATDKVLVKDNTKDTPFHITIRAYAEDNREKIVVDRVTTFVFPRYDIYEKGIK